MIVYLVRHGIAEDFDPASGKKETERILTVEGRKKVREVGKGLKALGEVPARIGSSPLARARETAEILRTTLGVQAGIEECPFLAAGPEPDEVVRWLKAKKCVAAMLVGHFPYLAQTASELVSGTQGVKMTLKRAGVICVSFEGTPAKARATLEWLVQPRHLRGARR